MTNTTPSTTEMLYRVKDIVAAYVSNNALPAADVPKLIAASHAALQSLIGTQHDMPVSAEPLAPAVPIKKSVTPSHIVCLDCGRVFASMKRHLATAHALAPQQYRTKWDLPENYPMVASVYSARRSTLAKEIDLGRTRSRRAAAG